MSEMEYSKSNLSSGTAAQPMGETGESIEVHQATEASEAMLNYPSLSREGMVNVEFPVRPGREPFGVERRGTEKLLARNVVNHIAAQVQRGFRVSPSEAIETLHWYIGCVQGAELLDSKSVARLEKLGRSFASASKPEEFYAAEVQPFLRSLTPQRRG